MELVEGLRSHEDKAYAYLYDHYSRALFTVICQRIQDQDEAEEVLQEVFVKIWQNIGSYDPSKGRIYTWMINVARNHSIDRVRSKTYNHRNMTASLDEAAHDNSPAQAAGPKDVGLLKTIDNLPEESRKMIELAYFEGYTHNEISQMLEMPLGTVKSKIRNTIIQLRNILSTNYA